MALLLYLSYKLLDGLLPSLLGYGLHGWPIKSDAIGSFSPKSVNATILRLFSTGDPTLVIQTSILVIVIRLLTKGSWDKASW